MQGSPGSPAQDHIIFGVITMKQRSLILTITSLVVVAIGIAVTLVVSKPSNQGKLATPGMASTAVAPKDANSIAIQNYKFNPSPLKVKLGTTVTWTNTDIARHSVEVDEGQPAGGPSGPLFGKGESFQFTFNTVGTFNYHCGPHPYMHGAVEVTQ